MPRLENWYVMPEPYYAPELNRKILCGIINGHPRCIDGEQAYTSRPVSKNNVGQVITMNGTVYDLGEVDPVYEKQFPNARERLLNSLPLTQ